MNQITLLGYTFVTNKVYINSSMNYKLCNFAPEKYL